jgi:hypothetical protein
MSEQETNSAEQAAAQAAATTAAPAAPNDYTALTPVSFHFKVEKLRDEKGTVVGEGKKLPKADLYLPVPTRERIAEILLDDSDKFSKEKKLLEDAILDVVYSVARGQINAFREVDANKDTPITQSVLNLDKLDWTAIANMPKGERGTSVPSDEDLQSFYDSYLAIMPEAANKGKEKIENHIVLFKAKFKKQRSQKDLLEVFRNALAVYASAAGDDVLEDQLSVVEYFSNMLERYLKSEEKITLEDI